MTLRSCVLALLSFIIVGSCARLSYGQRLPESDEDRFARRMLSFDKNHDNQLTRAEMTDARLLRLFDRADANHDGIVTESELRGQYLRESENMSTGRGGPGGMAGPGGLQMGQVLPPRLQDELELTADQKTKLLVLQHDVDARLKNLLTEKQRNRLNNWPPRPGPNGFYDGPAFPAPKIP